MNSDTLVDKLGKLLDDPTVPPSAVILLVQAIMDACDTVGEDLVVLQKLWPVMDTLRDIVGVCE